MSVSGHPPSQPYEHMALDHGQHSQAYPGNFPGGPAMDTHGGPPPGGGGHGDTHGGGVHKMINSDTGESPRRCTDLTCCVCWVITMITVLTVLMNCSIHGNTGRLTHGVDYYGRTCGNDAGVENKPFLFWCREHEKDQNGVVQAALNTGVPKAVDLDHPICVQVCPTDVNAEETCMLRVEHTNSTLADGPFDTAKTQIVQIRESKVYTKSYPTKMRGGRYCMPRADPLRNQILETWFRGLGPMSPRRILVAIGTIQNVWWLFFCVLLLSLLMGYGYLYCIKFCPKYVVLFATVIPMLWCFATAFGFSFFWMPLALGEDAGIVKTYMKLNPLYWQWSPTIASWITAFFCLVFWFGFLFFVCLIQKFDGLVISDLIHAVFDVFRTDTGMLMQPALEAVTKFVVFWWGIQGLKTIAAEGWIEKNNIEVNGARFAGLSRDYTPSVEDGRFYLLLVGWIIVWFWSMEICNAFGQFVTSYEVFQYYSIKLVNKKKEKQKPSAIWNGIKYGYIYHFGSIAKGAATIWMTRPIRFFYWASATLLEKDPNAPCCLSCLQSIMSFLCCLGLGKSAETGCRDAIRDSSSNNKDGYHDVVVRSNDWEAAVQKGHDLLEHSHPIVKNLYQRLDQMTINVVGIISIASLNALMVFLFTSLLDAYKEPQSNLYIADTMLCVFMAWILSAYIAFSFMTLWDHTCDGLLYYYAWSRKWKRETVADYMPESLRYIVGFDDVENDRYPYYGRAKNNMYLRSWLPMVGVDEKRKKPSAGDARKTGLPPPQSHMSEPQGSYMSGFGTGFGAWGRQEQAVSGANMMGGGEGFPLLH